MKRIVWFMVPCLAFASGVAVCKLSVSSERFADKEDAASAFVEIRDSLHELVQLLVSARVEESSRFSEMERVDVTEVACDVVDEDASVESLRSDMAILLAEIRSLRLVNNDASHSCGIKETDFYDCLLYTSPSPRDS